MFSLQCELDLKAPARESIWIFEKLHAKARSDPRNTETKHAWNILLPNKNLFYCLANFVFTNETGLKFFLFFFHAIMNSFREILLTVVAPTDLQISSQERFLLSSHFNFAVFFCEQTPKSSWTFISSQM